MNVLGYISLVCFITLVIKYPLRRLGLHKANAFMMKLHELASLGVFVCGGALLIKGIKYLKEKPLQVISGAVSYALDFIIIAACHMTKDVRRKMRDHRILSLMATLSLAFHIVAVLYSKAHIKLPMRED